MKAGYLMMMKNMKEVQSDSEQSLFILTLSSESLWLLDMKHNFMEILESLPRAMHRLQ